MHAADTGSLSMRGLNVRAARAVCKAPSSPPQALTILVAQPLLLLLSLLASFVLWPLIAPLVVWLPGIGRLLGGAAVTDAYSAGPSGVLTRRLEHVRDWGGRAEWAS